MQDKPKLFSTALMWLLAELFEELPEAGDLDEAEAVLLLRRGAPALRRAPPRRSSTRSTQTVRLIRSKGVGVYFITQTPKDIDEDVLAQLGNRVQHALRAFTPDDAKALTATAKTFPKSDFYDLEQLLHPARDRRGGGDDPRPRTACRRRSCTRGCGRRSRGWARPTTSTRAAKASPLYAKYGTRVDPQSAREMLAARLRAGPPPAADAPPRAEARAQGGRRRDGRRRRAIGDFLNSSAGKQLQREVVRGVFGLLKKSLR